MKISKEIIEKLKICGKSSYYLLDTTQFVANYCELIASIKNVYANANIAYSYKTNYTPRLCSIVNELGGYAEVVSSMEMQIAYKIGVKAENIIFNGPYKDEDAIERLLIDGGIVNIDNRTDFETVVKISDKYPTKKLNVGVRCNFDIGNNSISRFGFDVNSDEFGRVICSLKKKDNLIIKSLHCHFAARNIEYWKIRATTMLELIDKFELTPQLVDLGGGIFGKMPDSLKQQFDSYIPSYLEYANEMATVFAKRFGSANYKPQLVVEPGSALVGDAMFFVAKVTSIKSVRGKNIATVLGSIYNINPTLNKKNPPITVIKSCDNSEHFDSIDIGGYTCIESDYLYRGYKGDLAVGDYVVFGNVGSYSVVLKPPFILPNFAIYEYDEKNDRVIEIKREESFDDLFRTYNF